MKVTWRGIFVLSAALFFTAAVAAPADKPAQDEVVDFVPLEENPGGGFYRDGVVDVDASDSSGFFGNPFGANPLPSLFNSIEEIMNRMRQQIGQILGRLPEKPGDSPFPELHLPNIGDIDLGKGNTTSVTKIIDGHKVVINETEYKQGGENGTLAIFKVRVIDVHPESNESAETVAPEDSTSTPAPVKDRESIEDTISNEISKNSEELNLDNIETLGESEEVPPYKTVVHRNVDWNGGRSIENIDDNSIEEVDSNRHPGVFYDLSNDIYVNKLMADAGAPTNPDAEVFQPYTSDNSIPQYRPASYPPMSNVPPQFERLRAPFSNEIPYYAPPAYPLPNTRYLPPPPPPPPIFQQLNHRFSLPQPDFMRQYHPHQQHQQMRSLDEVSPSAAVEPSPSSSSTSQQNVPRDETNQIPQDSPSKSA